MMRIDFNRNWLLTQPGGMLEGFSKGKEPAVVNLPHDALLDTQRCADCKNGPDTAWYSGGTYVYTKKLVVKEAWQNRELLLEFEGVCETASVFVNDQFAGKHPYAYSGFQLNITKFLDPAKENEIKVIAKTGMQQTSRWYTGAGIFRPVWLLVSNDVSVVPDGIKAAVVFCDETLARIRVQCAIKQYIQGQKRVRVETAVLSKTGETAAKSMQEATLFDTELCTLSSSMDLIKPDLWDVDHPRLYTVQVTVYDNEIQLEQQTILFGIRSICADTQNGLRINGKTVKLRGACIHHDNGLLGGISLKDAELRRVKRLKAAGFNALRSAHNPASRYLLEACDEVGMLVMDELFDVWNTSKRDHDYSLYFAEWWRADMEAAVHKDFNHPCVVIYSVGNEIPETGTPAGAAQNREMTQYLHSLDPSRLVTNCVNGMFSVMPKMREILAEVENVVEIPEDINELMTMFDKNIDTIMRHPIVSKATEETFAGVDICGYNYMDSRYLPDGVQYPNRIIVGSETNPGKIGCNWPLVTSLPYVIGDFCWTGWEYLGEAGVGKNDYDMTHAMYGPWPWFLAYCGDHDLCGNRRPQSYYREIVFGLCKEPYLCVERPENHGREKCVTNWTWSDVIESWTWHGFEGKKTNVEVYAKAKEVDLYLNGKLVATKTVGEAVPYQAIFEVEYQPGVLTAIAREQNQEIGRMSLTTTGTPAAIKLTPESTTAVADGMSLLYLAIDLTDENGALACADAEVEIQVSGPAILAGFGSSNPATVEGFTETRHTTFDGKALAILRTTQESGRIVVTAKAEGLQSARVELFSVEKLK